MRRSEHRVYLGESAEATIITSWIINGTDGMQIHTISYRKKDCIQKFLVGSEMNWKEAAKYGWECIKVKLTIEEV